MFLYLYIQENIHKQVIYWRALAMKILVDKIKY